MSLPRWRSVPLETLVVADGGWRYDDPVMAEKLRTSLRRHGQLRAVVVRTLPDGRHEVVDGRRLVAAMRDLRLTDVAVADVGAIDTEAAQRMAFDLDLRFETDYARLALAVAALVAAGATPEALAATSVLDAERLGHMADLAVGFDWSQFSSAPQGQGSLMWDGEGTQLPEPLAPEGLATAADWEDPVPITQPQTCGGPEPEPEWQPPGTGMLF